MDEYKWVSEERRCTHCRKTFMVSIPEIGSGHPEMYDDICQDCWEEEEDHAYRIRGYLELGCEY